LPAGCFLKAKRHDVVWFAALVASAALLLLPWLVKLDGRPHADWQQFLGRFHPLAVHLPIGLIVLVPLLEIAGRFRPALREAAGFALGLGISSVVWELCHWDFCSPLAEAITALPLRGTCGAESRLRSACCLCFLARPWWTSGSVPRVYPLMLACVLMVLVWATHQGGTITHGSNYLTQYMPAPLKRLSTLGTVQANAPLSGSFYTNHIHPIFDANCVTCHGDGKVNGGLRLDSYELLMKGGKDGPVIVAGDPEKSLLFERVTLQPDQKHFMPAEGRPPLKPEEIAWIRAWIQQGASPSATSLSGIAISDEPKEQPLQPVGDYSGLMPEIRQMEKGQGAKLIPVSSKPGDGLILSTADAAGSFGDAQLAQFQKFGPYIVEAELGRTAVTNASFDTLSKFAHLRALHLEGTAVTGDGLAKLAPLSQLTYLNLSGTKVTQAAIAPLTSMKNLRHIYLYNTPAQPALNGEATKQIARSAP
jgi:mono/diheme cytochrome c family protein